MRVLRSLIALLALAGALVLPASAGGGERPRVLAVTFENDVNPVTADYVNGQIDRANEEGYDAVVILLDTPGGLAEAMRDIVKKELESAVPVIVYVSPDGARAASAGVWIGQAADILAMAPQTNIGSSTPVSLGGEEIQEDLKRKVVNDAVSSLTALAEEHGRNTEWPEQAVREGANLTAREALELGVIDLIAPDLPALLDEIDGQTTVPKGLVLDTADAEITTVEMSLWDRILDTLIDPNVITLLLSLGVLAITVELFNPGLIFPAAFGAISLVLAFFGLQVLPFSWAGILLLLVALGFFIAEAFVVSHGALAVAGAVAFVFGALLLFRPAGAEYETSLWVAVGLAAVLVVAFGFIIAKGVAARKGRPRTGSSELLGQIAEVRRDLEPEGYVFVHGELWRARAPEGARIPAGSFVRVDGVGDDLVLDVQRVPEPETAVPA